MNTLAHPQSKAPEAERFVFRDADWQMYLGMLQTVGERRIRVIYQRGCLELRRLSFGHARASGLLAQVVHVLTEELDLPCQSAGSTTFHRQDMDCGLEPDSCFYLDHELAVRGKKDLDLFVDPPPDLALEVDITPSSLNRLGIYAALRVPEVWRYDSGVFSVLQLTPDGDYDPVRRSRFFPKLPPELILNLLERRGEMSGTDLFRSFRRWVREQIAQDWPANA